VSGRRDPVTGERLFSPHDLAAALDITAETVRALVADGQLPGAFRTTRRGEDGPSWATSRSSRLSPRSPEGPPAPAARRSRNE